MDNSGFKLAWVILVFAISVLIAHFSVLGLKYFLQHVIEFQLVLTKEDAKIHMEKHLKKGAHLSKGSMSLEPVHAGRKNSIFGQGGDYSNWHGYLHGPIGYLRTSGTQLFYIFLSSVIYGVGFYFMVSVFDLTVIALMSGLGFATIAASMFVMRNFWDGLWILATGKVRLGDLVEVKTGGATVVGCVEEFCMQHVTLIPFLKTNDPNGTPEKQEGPYGTVFDGNHPLLWCHGIVIQVPNQDFILNPVVVSSLYTH
jgi:small-conductance mechanosensitive channel